MSYSKKKRLKNIKKNGGSYFQQQGLEVFLEKLKTQQLVTSFANSTTDCFVPEVVEFYDNDSDKLLGLSTACFDVYVRENKNFLDANQRLVHKHNPFKPWSLQKGEITPIDFSEFEIPMHQKVGSQISDEIESSTLVECGLTVTQGSSATSKTGAPNTLWSCFWISFYSSTPTLDTLVQDRFF